MRPIPAKARKRQRGAAQIEFIMTFFTIIFVLYGVIEISMAVYTMSVLGDAAREGVRYAIVHGTNNTNSSCDSGFTGTTGCVDVGAANVIAAVKDYARFSLHDTTAITVTVDYDPVTSNTPPTLVKVGVSYTYLPWIKLPWTNPVLRAGAQGRIVN